MIRIYRKTATINAEQFDCSDEMLNRYGLVDRGGHIVDGLHVDNMCFIPTLEGQMKINLHDWIATGVNGEHWAITDDVFKKTYAELPVIPKAVAAYIKKCKHDGIAIASAMDEEKFPKNVADYFRTYYTRDQWIEIQDTFARAWLDGYLTEEDE